MTKSHQGRPLGAVRIPLAAAAALMAAAGCASAERPAAMASSASSAPVFLKLQQRGSVGGLAVTPLRVEEDSRCPTGVQCIQAGNVRLSVRIGAGAPRTLTRGQPFAIDSGAWLTLCDVVPYPARPGRIRPAAYRFGFVLRRSVATPERASACPAPVAAPGG